ncbi:MAG: alpha/beta hydrolase [Solirubrobacterales bacterium]|jgi:acetyl esterase|nr:alpha/beta hydrolase [Solirubrobacterales bacterium]
MAEVDPEVGMVLKRLAQLGRPSLQDRALAVSRADHDADSVWVSGPGQEVARVEGCSVPGPGGPIPVRIYWPMGAEPSSGPGVEREADPPGCTGASRSVSGDAPLPVVAYFHGGGWLLGSIDSFDCVCRALSNAAGAIVMNVGYRLAPEHPFPAAADDAEAAVRWLAEHAGELGGDPERLAVVGDSAGANLATVAARRAHDARIRFQVLVYPVTDCHRDDDDPAMRWMWATYAGDDAGKVDADPDIAPLRGVLDGLPPALILCAEEDPLRVDGEAYAAALREAGVDVEHRTVSGTTHGFWRWLALCAVARRTVDEVGLAVRGALV